MQSADSSDTGIIKREPFNCLPCLAACLGVNRGCERKSKIEIVLRPSSRNGLGVTDSTEPPSPCRSDIRSADSAYGSRLGLCSNLKHALRRQLATPVRGAGLRKCYVIVLQALCRAVGLVYRSRPHPTIRFAVPADVTASAHTRLVSRCPGA